MSLIVKDPRWDDVLDVLEQASQMHHKLILVVGPTGSGKTVLLKQVGGNSGYLDLREKLNQKFSSTPHFTSGKAKSIAHDLINAIGTDRIAIDSTEILFDAPFSTEHLNFLKQLSLHRVLVVSWTKYIDEDALRSGIQRPSTSTDEDGFIIALTGTTVSTRGSI